MASASIPVEAWALPRLQHLLPLDEESLHQVISYADSLPKAAAAEHLKNLLGEEASALEFIEGFNLRRPNAPAPNVLSSGNQNAPSTGRQADATGQQQQPWKGHSGTQGKKQKKKSNIHALPARQLARQGDVAGGYQKRTEDDYMPASISAKQKHKDQIADNLALTTQPEATQMPLITDNAALTKLPVTTKAPPSAAGPLISDMLGPKKGSQSPRTASPAPTKAKVKVTGGTAMHGASTALSDLDSAIRSLELQTNPTLASASPQDADKRKCNCMATRHPLLDIAPNCLSCGKVICVKEGLGPCTFCNAPLLPPDEIAAVLRVLKLERGDERTRVNNTAHRRADVSQGKARAFTGRDFLAANPAAPSGIFSPGSGSGSASPAVSDDDSESAAQQSARAHRDRLLGFQANNARRTRIHDEAADFDIPSSGTNMWASPAERAQQLKKQQKVLREMEWNARPEYEKRKVVASIDLVGRKVVRRMAEVERPDFGSGEGGDDDDSGAEVAGTRGESGGESGGAFSKNPLARGLIKPVAREGKGKGRERESRDKGQMWRRVQMDGDDNEQWILDGGVYGGQVGLDRALGEEEHAIGS